MAAPLTESQISEYTTIIDGILSNLSASDLETVTSKKVRQGLEAALGGKDLSEQKAAIKELIGARFDAISAVAQASGTIPTPPPAGAAISEPSATQSPIKHDRPPANGHSREHDVDVDAEPDADDDAEAEIEVALPVPTKKRKREDLEDADARLAAELQAQENQLARGRTTRGGSATKAVKKKNKTPRKKNGRKSKHDIDSDDDASEESGSQAKRKSGGGFQKPFNLSFALAELVGESQLSRPQVVKKLWEHIKGNDLQDPNDKRQIRCDEKMSAVFKLAKVDMFQMNKLLGNHLYPVDEE